MALFDIKDPESRHQRKMVLPCVHWIHAEGLAPMVTDLLHDQSQREAYA
jgi:hypothetical protein